MLRPSGNNPYEDALIEKIRETTETIVLEDRIAKHPEQFAGDRRAATILARAKLQAKRPAAKLTFAARARKRT